jgi:hypothetical protein
VGVGVGVNVGVGVGVGVGALATLMLAELFTPFGAVATTVVLPEAMPVTNPVWSTVATDVLRDCHENVTFWIIVPDLSLATAVSCPPMPPATRFRLVGVIWTDAIWELFLGLNDEVLIAISSVSPNWVVTYALSLLFKRYQTLVDGRKTPMSVLPSPS